MKQHVNLYTDEFKPRKIVLPLEHIILLCALALVLLILTTFALRMAIDSDREALQVTQAKADSMSERVTAMEKEVSLRILDESLVQANKRLNEKVAARKEMIKALDSLDIEDGSGEFSSLMTALARQTSKNLWLEHINVGASGKTMVLAGRTLDAGEVPNYLQKLRNEPAFVGRNFTLFQLEVDETRKREIQFELKSEVLSDTDTSGMVSTQPIVYPTLSVGGAQ